LQGDGRRRGAARFGRLDVLFNNAGIMHPADDDAEKTDEEIWDLTMAINLKGVFLGCKYGIPALRRAGGGTVINTASFVAVLGAATPQLAYTASKGGVLAMTRELAIIHAREGIRVNALCPGPLKTEMLMKFLDTEAKRQRRWCTSRWAASARRTRWRARRSGSPRRNRPT
jgi:NAD(P)-dependent dehydrogenase (short-subunit alcohol dehydrogenase family)